MESICSSLHFRGTYFRRSLFEKCGVLANVILLIVLYFVFAAANSYASHVQVSWYPSPSPGVSGYMIYYGVTSHDYAQTIDVGNTTEYNVYNLINGQTYYFAVTAYNPDGDQSAYSDEASITIFFKPVIKGDIDGNGLVNLADALQALQAISGMQPAIRTDYTTSGADVNGNGKLELIDTLYILQYSAGLRQ